MGMVARRPEQSLHDSVRGERARAGARRRLQSRWRTRQQGAELARVPTGRAPRHDSRLARVCSVCIGYNRRRASGRRRKNLVGSRQTQRRRIGADGTGAGSGPRQPREAGGSVDREKGAPDRRRCLLGGQLRRAARFLGRYFSGDHGLCAQAAHCGRSLQRAASEGGAVARRESRWRLLVLDQADLDGDPGIDGLPERKRRARQQQRR